MRSEMHSKLHSSELELRSLLAEETDEGLDPTVSDHVEHCAHCQERLAKLSGVGAWTHALVSHLRTLDSDERDLYNCPPHTTIELRAGALQDDAPESGDIELEPVSLDFLEPAVHPELLGRLGRFDIERVIGAGGMGVVFKAHDGELHRAVAVKVLAPHLANSAAARRRFAREAQAAAAVIHPNVIPIHNVESDGKIPYLVMQYVAGESLQTRVDRLGPLPIADVLRIAQQTAAGLSAAHAQGLIHRDVKPANILLEESIDRVVLSDFGLARTVDDASLTRTGIVTGTPHYMSPEQAGGEAIDCRSDQFSLGCVLYFMLTGRAPFRAESAMGVLNRICHHAHRPVNQINASVPRELSRVVDRLLAKSAGARFESAAACEAELSKLLSAVQSGRLRLVSERKPSNKQWRTLALATAGTLTVAGLLCVALWQSPTEEQTASPNTRPDDPLATSSVIVSQLAPFGGNVDIANDPAVTLLRNLGEQNPSDPWRQSLRELSEQIDNYERRSASPVPWQLNFGGQPRTTIQLP